MIKTRIILLLNYNKLKNEEYDKIGLDMEREKIKVSSSVRHYCTVRRKDKLLKNVGEHDDR